VSSAGETAQEAFRRGARQRLWLGLAGGVLILILVLLLGPDYETVRRRWDVTGKRGPVQLMPEVTVVDGSDPRYQLPKSLRDMPPPPNIEVEPPQPTGEPVPKSQPVPTPTPMTNEQIAADPDLDLMDQVELNSPMQSLTNPWFTLVRMVRPQYPTGVSEEMRRRPLVTVEAAHYVDELGHVTASYVVASDGGEEFGQAVLRALQQWIYKPVDPSGRAPGGFWKPTIWRFRSPYATLRPPDSRP
jgi:outer membrane biosynthesis protein TonB